MGIFLISWIVILLIAISIGLYHKSEYHKFFSRDVAYFSAIWAGVIMIIYSIGALTMIGTSYESYLDARAYYDNLLAQYQDSITLYENKAVAIDMERAAKNALTDLRFQGYQEKMAEFIMDLRSSIVWYNKMVIKKKYMSRNFFYGWYIMGPDSDMKSVNILDSKGK